jgi:DNA-binding NtrC family response regulator/NAD-dependent dihydropyrimidine dehydrogenase PreA subunit
MITLDDLLCIEIFKDLPRENLTALIPHLSEKNLPAGKTIIYRGDPGHSMFMILDGKVGVTLTNDEGVEYTLATLAAGDIFGEMALMTGEPRSANVKTLSKTRLFELSQKAFFELVTTYPALNDSLLRLLVQRRTRNAVQQAAPARGNVAALFAEPPPDVDQFIGKTNWTNETNKAINRLADLKENVLILGELGTGKDLAARLIHFNGPFQTEPLFHLDCTNPPPIQRSGQRGDVDRDSLHREIAHASALFGHGADAGSYARGIRRGYLELSDNGAIILENIDLLSGNVQRLLVKYIKTGVFNRMGETEQIASKVRLLATSSKSLVELKEEDLLDHQLLDLIGTEVLTLKPLRERKKDIPVLAEHFLGEYNRKFAKTVTSFSKEALNLLVDHSWPLNVDELHQVVERAVVVAHGNVIEESQVFLNIPTFSATGKYNLLRNPFFRKLVEHNLFPTALRYVTVPFILALIIFTLVGPPNNNPANLVVWAIWWPFLILSIIISGRGWCGYCPLPFISDGINFFRKKFLAIPGFLSKNGVWIGILGFAVVLISEHASKMFTTAYATSMLLLTILGGTVITNFFFGKRAWCKHCCPLGKMVAQTSVLSLIELESNSTVCSSQCLTHDCVKEGNCPMGLHPSVAGVSKDCILCMSCVKRCKHQAVRINARLPWNELLARKKADFPGAFFAIFLTALVMAMKFPSWGPISDFIKTHYAGDLHTADVAMSVTTGLAFTVLAFLASGFPKNVSWKINFSILGYAYLFLAFAGFFNIYFHEFVYSGHNLGPWTIATVGLSNELPSSWFTPDLGTLKPFIPLITLAGAITSLVMLSKLAKKHDIPAYVRRFHQGILFVTAIVFLVIL